MAIQLVGFKTFGHNSTTAQSTSLTDLTGGLAAAPAAGDIVLVSYTHAQASSNARTLAQCTPTGYTNLHATLLYPGAETHSLVFAMTAKLMGATPDTTISIPAAAATTSNVHVTIQVYRGANFSTITTTAPTTAVLNNTGLPNPPAITTPALTTCVVVCGFGAAIANATTTAITNAGTPAYTGSTFLTGSYNIGTGSRAVSGMAARFNPGASLNYDGVLTGGATVNSGSWAAVSIVLREPPSTSITQAAYRWYSDGTESGAPVLAAQDVNIEALESTAIYGLRLRLQETGGVSGAATDDYMLQYNRKNLGWNNVTTTSAVVRSADTTNFVDGAATTNRLTAGTGAFVAGKCAENTSAGVVDLQITANNFTELLYAIQFVPADVVGNDFIDFRVMRNGAVLTTYTLTPSFTITPPPPTTLFLRNTTTNGIPGYRDMLPVAGAATSTAVVNTSANAEDPWTDTPGGAQMIWVSGRVPVGGFTLSGPITFNIWAHESNAAANEGARAIVHRRTTGGIENNGQLFDDGVEFALTTTEMGWTGAPTAITFLEDERLVFRLFITPVGTSAPLHTCTLTYDGPDAAVGDSFIQISEQVAFKAEAGGGGPTRQPSGYVFLIT